MIGEWPPAAIELIRSYPLSFAKFFAIALDTMIIGGLIIWRRRVVKHGPRPRAGLQSARSFS